MRLIVFCSLHRIYRGQWCPFCNTHLRKLYDELRRLYERGASGEEATISKIFSWFSGDFKQDAGSIREYFNRYAREKLGQDGKITHLDYDWRLNDIHETNGQEKP